MVYLHHQHQHQAKNNNTTARTLCCLSCASNTRGVRCKPCVPWLIFHCTYFVWGRSFDGKWKLVLLCSVLTNFFLSFIVAVAVEFLLFFLLFWGSFLFVFWLNTSVSWEISLWLVLLSVRMNDSTKQPDNQYQTNIRKLQKLTEKHTYNSFQMKNSWYTYAEEQPNKQPSSSSSAAAAAADRGLVRWHLIPFLWKRARKQAVLVVMVVPSFRIRNVCCGTGVLCPIGGQQIFMIQII